MASRYHYAYTLQFPIGKQGVGWIELNKSYFYCWLQPLLFTCDHFKLRQVITVHYAYGC